jgi:outer membrane protein
MFALATATAATDAPKQTGLATLSVLVNGLKSNQGVVRLALFNSESSYTKKTKPFRSARVAIEDKGAQWIVNDLPFGEYALSWYQDENANGKLDTNPVGIPTEPFGFSNNPRASIGPPKYAQARFIVDEPKVSVQTSVQSKGGQWSLGAGAGIGTRPYVDADDRTLAIPLVTYQGKRLSIEGIQVRYRLAQRNNLSVNAMALYRFSGYEEDDSDFLEGMSDREDTIDAGLNLEYALTQRLAVKLRLVADVLSRNDGYESSLSIERTFRRNRWTFIPSAGVSHVSENFADYYYGVRASEATPVRPQFEVNAADNWRLSARLSYFYSNKLFFLTTLTVDFLDDEIVDSPIVEDDTSGRLLVGAVYNL